MEKGFKYVIKGKRLLITESPAILTRDMIEMIIKDSQKKFNTVELCENIEIIGSEAFSCCEMLKKIKLPKSLKLISAYAFAECISLKKVCMYEGVEEIGLEAFSACKKLRTIRLPNSIKRMGRGVFQDCFSLYKVNIPNLVNEISEGMFCDTKIKKIYIPEGIEKLDELVFYRCTNLKKVSLSNSINQIGESCFGECVRLKSIVIPEGVTKINDDTFKGCIKLRKVVLPSNLRIIGNSAFDRCYRLNGIFIPDKVVTIGKSAFYRNIKLNKIRLPNSLQRINSIAFSNCNSLKKMIIPEGVEIIESNAFFYCDNLRVIYLPSTLRTINHDVFEDSTCLEKIYLNTKNGTIEIDMRNNRLLHNACNCLFVYNNISKNYCFYFNGEYVNIDQSIYNKIRSKLPNLHYFINYYYWMNRKFIPNYIVISQMPVRDIDNFYVNNNCKEWRSLINESRILIDTNKETFFKLCYVLGVFNASVSVRDKAVKFIRESIIGKINEFELHARFDGFDLNNGFNEEYSQFFMKYYNDDFMKIIDVNGEEINLVSASYNNFYKVKEAYPGKLVNTNRKADVLLPTHVADAIRLVLYKNVEDDNKELARVVGRYGYTQEQFDRIQELFNIGKSIEEKDLKLFISKDNKNNVISYKLLVKNDPLGVVLGNITNCCQVIGGIGESCVKYGVTQPNSKFMVFDYDNTIIGQSWVWYDEKTKTICLDNIEVPGKYCDVLNKNKELQQAFIKCLYRVSLSFKEEMNCHGLQVDHVTIGQGYNDIKKILNEEFGEAFKGNRLKGYNGYSDAIGQYEIKGESKIVK